MKKITSFLLTFLILITFSLEGFASVLGSSLIDGYTVTIGKGTTFTSRIYQSDQSGVGRQTENFITYSPNADVEPIITHGEKLYGRKTISAETSRLSNIVNLTGGINADYFSLQTGVPMGNLISDGKIVTKDASGQDMIAIMENGEAFMSYATFASILTKADGTEVNIYNINKYRQPYSAYLMTEEFSDTTRASGTGYNIILGSVNGEMRLGEELTAVVESVTLDDGAVAIPSGKLVLTIDEDAPAEFLDPIASLQVGETVKISFGAIGEDTRWNDVKLAMGSVGGRLIINGEVNPDIKNNGAAPRTAIGIKEDGSLILYTIDGRQSGHSYGVQLTTLANRMKELGCVEALNLDGGGSTSIVSLFPGDGVPVLRNKPSDGSERAVSTFFFLKNNLNPTGELGGLTFYPFTAYVLTGADKQFSIKAHDTSFYPMDVPEGINFSIDTEGAQSEINSVGLFTAKDDGVVRIKAESGDISAVMDVVCLKTPTDLYLTNDEGTTLSSAYVSEGGIFQFTAVAYGGYNRLTAENNDFTWSVSPEIGTIDENGLFTANRFINQTGTVSVSAGDKTVSIPVTVSYTPDPSNPDSYPTVTISADKNSGVISAKIATALGIPTSKDGIRVTIDGTPVSFEFNEWEGTLTLPYPEDASHISIFATNNAGYTGFGGASLTLEDEPSVFADAEGHWAEKELNAMYRAGIINGEEYGGELIFRPQKQMNRSEFAVMICNYLGIDTAQYESVSLPFEDAGSIPAWALNATKALYDRGILSGKSTSYGTLIGEPLSPITRAEACTIIVRTLSGNFYLEEFGYSDMNMVPEWAQNSMNTLLSIGVLGGYADGTLMPQGYLTKAEAAKILYNIL